MEKLRKALDRAKEARRAPASGGGAGKTELRAAVPRSDMPAYEYSETRTFDADPELLENNRILSPRATTPSADAFRMLRTQVAQRLNEHGWRTLAVVSPCRGDGRTLAAVNLAVTLAADPRHSVLLCDLDLREPGIAPLFGLVPEAGVDDVLAGRAQVEDCLVHPRGFDRLVLLPARAPLASSSEHLASAATKQLVGELRERYPDRILIFDLPAVLVADDALAFSACVESAMLVVTEGTTRRDDIVRTLEIMRNTPVVGTLLNRSLARVVPVG